MALGYLATSEVSSEMWLRKQPMMPFKPPTLFEPLTQVGGFLSTC
jgi:hypothetical protein